MNNITKNKMRVLGECIDDALINEETIKSLDDYAKQKKVAKRIKGLSLGIGGLLSYNAVKILSPKVDAYVFTLIKDVIAFWGKSSIEMLYLPIPNWFLLVAFLYVSATAYCGYKDARSKVGR